MDEHLSKLVDFFTQHLRLSEDEQNNLLDLVKEYTEAVASDALDREFNRGRYRY